MFNSKTGRPILPPTSEFFLKFNNTWLIKETVVDFPLEPVTQIIVVFFFFFSKSSKNKPMSLSILTELFNA